MQKTCLEPARKHVLYILVALSFAALTSPAQITNWSYRPGPSTSVAFGNGLYVGLVGTSSIRVSSNGSDWVRRLLPCSLASNPKVRFVNGRFYILSAPMLSSADGLNWMNHSNTALATGIAYGNGKYVLVNSTGPGIMVSTDALNWTIVYSSSISFWDITFGAGLFVACADQDILSSPDGLNWTYASSLPTSGWPLYSVAYGNGTFAALSQYKVITSADALNWSSSLLPNAAGWRIGWGIGTFVAVAGRYIYASTNASDWVGFTNAYSFSDLTFSTTTCYLVGNSTNLESNPLIAPANLPTTLQMQLHPGIQVTGDAGSLHRIEYTDDPARTNWTTATQLYLRSNPTLWLDPQPATGQRFYRSIRLD